MENLDSIIQELKSRIGELEDDNHSLSNQLDEAKNQNEALKKEIEELNVQLMVAESTVRETECDWEEAEAENKYLQGKVDAYEFVFNQTKPQVK